MRFREHVVRTSISILTTFFKKVNINIWLSLSISIFHLHASCFYRIILLYYSKLYHTLLERVFSMSKAMWGLEKLDLFDNLNPMELQEITKIANKVFLHKGDIITDKDDKSRNVFVLINGSVEIISLKGVPLYRVSKGEVFGELAMLSTIQRSAVAVAREESWVIVINMNHLEHLGEEYPDIYTKVTKNLVFGLGVKLARANKLIELLKEELMKAIKK